MKRHIFWISAVLLSLSAAALIWLYQKPADWGPRHDASGYPRVIFTDGMAFDIYLEKAHDLGRKVTARFSTPVDEEMLAWRLPFSRQPATDCALSDEGRPLRGMLMVHGLTDSPATQISLADAYAEACFQVYAIALPGHGTAPGELSKATWQEWMAALRYGLTALDAAVDGPIAITGYSTGLTLAVLDQLDLQSPTADLVSALVGMAPGLSGPFPIPGWQRTLAQASWTFPRFRYGSGVCPDENPGRYESSPTPALFQYLLLQDQLGPLDDGPAVDLPTYFAHTDADTTIPVAGVIAFFCNRLAGPRHLRLYSNNPDLVSCNGVDRQDHGWPEKNVLSTGHVGVLNAPDHPIFGRDGFPDCRHYWGQPPYGDCKTAREGFVFAEATPDMMAAHLVRRASFNPDFDAMADDIIAFLDRHLPPVR